MSAKTSETYCDKFNFDDIFGVGIPPVEEIDIDEEEEAKKYMLKLYERIRRIEDQDINDEVVRSNSNEANSSTISFSDDSYEGVAPEVLDVREFLNITTNGQTMILPVFKDAKKTKEWGVVLDHHENRLRSILTKLREVEEMNVLRKELDDIQYQSMSLDFSQIRDKSKRTMAQRTMRISLAEELIAKRIGSLAFYLKDLKVVIDDTTEGVWVERILSGEGKSILDKLSTTRIPVTRKYKLDQYQTQNLVNLLFTNKDDTRAFAKLNLSAKLEYKVYKEMVSDPAKVLEAICSEAYLTQMEILYLVFPKSEKGENRVCLTCGTAVSLSRAMYHTECQVIKWLTKYCRFTYDNKDACLTPKTMNYLAQEKYVT